MFEKITKTLSGLAFIKYINSLIDYVNTSDIDATRIKGQLDISNIPPAGLDNIIKVDTVTDMLALTVDDVQNGDTVMIIGVTPPVQYQVADDTKLGTMDAFQEYAAGTATKALADINGNNIHTTYGKLAGNNYWNGSNVYNKNITVSNGTASGSEGIIDLGKPPTSKTKQPNIFSPGNGNLIINASENSIIALQSGDVIQWSVVSDETNTKTSAYLHSNLAATYTPSGGVVWEGNAKTATTATSAKSATKLATARTINGVSFDGTANITIADSTKLPIAGGTMTGDLTLKGNPTADLMAATKKYVDDSVASAGGGDVLAAGNNSFTGANTFQNLVTMVGGVVFTSGTTTLAWKKATQIVATINASTYTGNSATATKLATARTITANLASSTAGSFDGSANITVGVTGTLPIAKGGTGATTAAAARTALGCAPAYTYSTTDLTAGSSALTTGTLYIVYE